MCQIDLYQETSLTMNEIFNSVTACISCSGILFYSFRAISTYIFETYFTFSVVLLRLHIPTCHWCLLFAYLFSCDCSSSLWFGTIDSHFSLYNSRNSSASWRRKACLLVFLLLHPCKWSMHWSPQDPICYRKHGQATDVLLLLYCICESFGQEYRLHTLFCCRTAQSWGTFCDFFQCQLYYATYSEAVLSGWLSLDRLPR